VQLREGAEEVLNGVFRASCREQHRWFRIEERRVETFSVTRQFGREQRHRDGPGLDRCVKPGNVVDALRCEDRNPVTAICELLHARGDRLQSGTQLGPGHLDGVPLRPCVVQVAIRCRVADIRDVAFDQRDQRGAWRHHNSAVGVQAILDP